MLQSIHKMKGQSTLEYAVLIMIIIAALLTIQQYVKRGIQGRMKSSTDDIGDQFSPNNVKANKTTITSSKTHDLYGQDSGGVVKQGISSSAIMGNEITNTTDNSSIINSSLEFMGK